MPLNSKNKDLEQLKKENARLTAALSEAEYECQRLEIMNANLEKQLQESNRELEKNIEVLQSMKQEIEGIVSSLKSNQ